MLFDWYNIFNLDEFLALNLVSRKFTGNLEGIGQVDLLVVKGNETSLVYEDVILPIGFRDLNPYPREGESATYAVYKDSNNDVWLGVEATA